MFFSRRSKLKLDSFSDFFVSSQTIYLWVSVFFVAFVDMWALFKSTATVAMGRYQRGMDLSAARLKRAEESSKFDIANFFLFSYTIFKQTLNVLSEQNKYYFHNWIILVENMIFQRIFSPEPQSKNSTGEIFCSLFVLARTGTLTRSHWIFPYLKVEKCLQQKTEM